jgi:dihydrofolate synthase/folylpolyglutamate synthase
MLCDSFEQVEQARADTLLTYFEFGTLSALAILSQQELDVAILEVGLGGRLDAVNLVDANAALITSIGIDHSEWLGADRDSIAREKAGILRPHQFAVCTDMDPPASLLQVAQEKDNALALAGKDFGWQAGNAEWDWWWQDPAQPACRHLPLPGIAGSAQLQNAAVVLAVIHGLDAQLPVTCQATASGLQQARLAGRFQQEILAGGVERVMDVAHNPQAAQSLARSLRQQPVSGRTHAVLAMLAGKDVAGVVAALDDDIDSWYVAGLQHTGSRDSNAEALAQQVKQVSGAAVTVCPSVLEAQRLALKHCRPGDRLLVFGSFYTVAQALSESV